MYRQRFLNKLQLFCLILAMLCVCVGGCGESDCMVHGTVTLDDEPLANGTISFLPKDDQTPTAGGVIEKGRYRLEVQPGPKTVQITASRVVGQEAPYEGDSTTLLDVTEQILPPRYNANSELVAEIVDGANTQDFVLTSAK